MKCIAYKAGYKYQLQEDYTIPIDIKPPKPINTTFLALDLEGNLTIRKGYAWDGPSGPTVDTKTFMRGALVHDALYQLMREKHLDQDACRGDADKTLKRICKEDGMMTIRTWWVYQAVRFFAEPAADPAKDRPVLYAP